MYNANSVVIFFLPFPTPFLWRWVDISVSQFTGEVSRVTVWLFLPPPGTCSVCPSLSFQYVDLSKIPLTAPTTMHQSILPSLMEAAICSVLRSLTVPWSSCFLEENNHEPGTVPDLLVLREKCREHCLHESFIGNSLNTWSTPETFQNNRLEEPSPPPKVSVNQQLHTYCPYCWVEQRAAKANSLHNTICGRPQQQLDLYWSRAFVQWSGNSEPRCSNCVLKLGTVQRRGR